MFAQPWALIFFLLCSSEKLFFHALLSFFLRFLPLVIFQGLTLGCGDLRDILCLSCSIRQSHCPQSGESYLLFFLFLPQFSFAPSSWSSTSSGVESFLCFLLLVVNFVHLCYGLRPLFHGGYRRDGSIPCNCCYLSPLHYHGNFLRAHSDLFCECPVRFVISDFNRVESSETSSLRGITVFRGSKHSFQQLISYSHWTTVASIHLHLYHMNQCSPLFFLHVAVSY